VKLKTISGLMLGAALTFAASGILPAQQPPSKGDMPMGDMPMAGMKECHEQHRAMTGSMDQITKTLEEAQQSNDVSKMKSAMAQVQKQLTDMKARMSKCDSMMNMMEKMHGTQGGMMK